MRFLGRKRRKINIRAKTEAKNKGRGDHQSLRPLGFAPPFGRAVSRIAAGLDTGLKLPLYLDAAATATAGKGFVAR